MIWPYGTSKVWGRRQLSLENGKPVDTKVSDGDVSDLLGMNAGVLVN